MVVQAIKLNQQVSNLIVPFNRKIQFGCRKILTQYQLLHLHLTFVSTYATRIREILDNGTSLVGLSIFQKHITNSC